MNFEVVCSVCMGWQFYKWLFNISNKIIHVLYHLNKFPHRWNHRFTFSILSLENMTNHNPLTTCMYYNTWPHWPYGSSPPFKNWYCFCNQASFSCKVPFTHDAHFSHSILSHSSCNESSGVNWLTVQHLVTQCICLLYVHCNARRTSRLQFKFSILNLGKINIQIISRDSMPDPHSGAF